MVKAWRELVTIPTYEVGKPEKNPMFLEKRVYQGSSGVVYPYPVIETISNEKVDKDYQAVWLENEYIKVMILPELGGRVQMAYDKIKQRHFVYYNHVIKPALVGLAGPWISGGIEFNWPQHHRPSTYMPIDSTIVENEDGSVTVWVNEMERMFHQKGMAGFTLRPGCAYLEIQGRVSNRTPLPQTFLWWANPAVEVNDAYQSVFPPDINAVFDHGKRAVSSFPIATGTYYKMDYSAGVDISNYKNIPVPTSYMAVNSKYDFEGGYENDTKGGMLHVASHHYSPGKKQWTWGNGDFGRAWDRNLTDEAPLNPPLGGWPGEVTDHSLPQGGGQEGAFRPYIELMAGVYTENQPDFTWLMPYEEKQFVQYFMPYRELGIVKQASKDFLFNIESLTSSPSSMEIGVDTPSAENVTTPLSQGEGPGVRLSVLATNKQDVCLILRNDSGEVYYQKEVTLSPEEVLVETVDVKGAKLNELTFEIVKTFGYGQRVILSWHDEPDEIRPIPDAAEAPLSPEDTKTNDQLYLTGLHLEQYRHATWSALDYYEEALRRDPNDVRCLNQIGLWYLRRGRFDKAEAYLRKAVKIWQKRNPNPYDGEAIFNLALALKYKDHLSCVSSGAVGGALAEAYSLFWKSTWNKAWADAGYFEAACISVAQGRFDDALDELNRCLVFNSCNHRARALKATVLRLQQEGRQKGALQTGTSKELNDQLTLIKESLQLDHFNYGILYEQYLLTKDEDVLKQIVELMHGNVYNYHELALDYALAGRWEECLDVLHLSPAPHPLTYYYIGWAQFQLGDAAAAAAAFKQAGQADNDCCFPNRLEDILVLESAKQLLSSEAKAPYYLGCLYYDKRQYDLAVSNWEQSARLDPTFPTVWRNLALARFNKSGRLGDSSFGRLGDSSFGRLGDSSFGRLVVSPFSRLNQVTSPTAQTTKQPTAQPPKQPTAQSPKHPNAQPPKHPNDQEAALEYMERAFALDESDARMLMELDQLRKRLHHPHAERLAFLQHYPDLIRQRDDLVLEEITLLNQLGRYEEAMQKLDNHVFHPWEGGEGKVTAQYQICRVEQAKQLLSECRECRVETVEFAAATDDCAKGKAVANSTLYTQHSTLERAKRLLEECLEYPHHLGEGKLYGAQENDFYYLLGIAYDALGQKAKAEECWEEATKGPQEPAAAIYYNDAKPDKIFYQGLALCKLGREAEAHGRFYRLINYGKQHVFEHQVMDYFAVSLPDLLIWEESGGQQLSSLDMKNIIHCKYMLALGYYGMGDNDRAERYLKELESLDNNHQGVQQLRTLINAALLPE